MGNDAATVPVMVVVAPAVGPVHHPVSRPPTAGPPSHLPFTGAPIDALTSIALALAVTGGAIVALIRRRTAVEPAVQTGAFR